MSKKLIAERGLFRRRGSPYWCIRYADRNGHIHRKSTGTNSKRLAREILAKQKVRVAENRHLDVKRVPNTTFYELCDQYWKLDGKHKRMKGLSNMVEIWKKGFGNVPVKELDQQKIERFLTVRMEEKKLQPASRNRHLAHLSSMFNKGKEWRLVTDNPAAGIKPLRENGARTRFFSGRGRDSTATGSLQCALSPHSDHRPTYRNAERRDSKSKMA